ncbi:hypothetical protein N7486_003166 [Penicillium sp. IBT 16267x]|nr:hypothetical protein N7486_003166 [Penicillium sp. IBT 16267x]
MHVQAEDVEHPSQNSMRHWPTSPLSLALSSILVLIPAPGDVYPPSKTVFLRQKYAEIYANSTLESVDRDIDLLGSTSTLSGAVTHLTSSLRTPLNPNVPLKLESLLALIILSAYQYCQRGNISKLRARANQAVTTAMDMSLHSLGREAVEAERRAWWMTVHMVYMSSSLNVSSPTILIGDPRISTPYPEFRVSLEPWSLMLKAQHALFTSTDLLKGFGVESKLPLPSLSGDQIHELHSYIETLVAESDRSLPMTNPQGAEAAAAQSMWMIARLLIYTARIKLHRFKAFCDMPIFLENHCGLTSINGVDSPYATLNRSLSQVTVFECIFPFTEQESSSICLKSALVVARVFKNLPHPDPTYSDVPSEVGRPAETIKSSANTTYTYPHTLPYFACSAIQGCYVLLMILYKIRASRASDHLSSCYHLLSHPGPGTEAQAFDRLVEEIRHAVDSLKASLQHNAMFEGVGRMGREIEGAFCAAFPG